MAREREAKIRCDACPVMCYIAEGKPGACDRYANHGGELVRLDPLTIVEHSSELVPFLQGDEAGDWDGDVVSDVAGTSIDAYANDSNPYPYPGEVENEPIPWYDLYPNPSAMSHNNGIAVDIGVAAQAVLPPQDSLPSGPFRFVRISRPPAGTRPTQIDSIVRLH